MTSAEIGTVTLNGLSYPWSDRDERWAVKVAVITGGTVQRALGLCLLNGVVWGGFNYDWNGSIRRVHPSTIRIMVAGGWLTECARDASTGRPAYKLTELGSARAEEWMSDVRRTICSAPGRVPREATR